MSNLDTAAIEMLKVVMEDDFAMLLDTFFEDSLQRIADLKRHVNDCDPDSFRKTAHSLKGSASNLGALAMTQLCLQAEEMGMASNLDGAENLVSEIDREYHEVSRKLETYR